MLFLSFISFGQASGGSFLVERRKILAGLLHDLHHVVEGDAMLSVGKAGVQIGIQGRMERVVQKRHDTFDCPDCLQT